ncbi:uncharacterized protein LOC128389788 [Panonychus citri]|uniref:uncharacterized protein LOC128389788 n=1 Tax=Panonychus citri TaxID=50023 RepID=UPI0023075702|nr:uncharacterized protein LOC128389788 [Panonychus citri]
MLANQWTLLITIVITLITLKLTLAGRLQSGLPYRYQLASGYRPYNTCPQLEIANGFVRHSRRTARFRCQKNFTLIGDNVIHCYGGEWDGDIPVCAAAGCLKFPAPKQGTIKKSFRDLYVTINCNPGYSLDGSSTVYCDGHYWNVSYPTVANMCKKTLSNPSTWCGFENHDQCGWTSDEPDRVAIEGPNTFGYRPYGLALSAHNGNGHMLVIWSTITGHSESVNRLYSPVYDTKESESCFTFWYHLGGYDKLTDPPPFKVYIRPESMAIGDVTPWIFITTADAYGQWTSGQVYVPKINSDWQIILEFNVWQKVYGLDDLSIDRNVTKCATRSTSMTGISNSWTSCKDRCSYEPKGSSSCSCSLLCNYLNNCCPDYEIYCSTNSTRDDDDFLDFDKMFSNETTTTTTILSSTSTVWIPTYTTPHPFLWFFTEFTPYSTKRTTLSNNQSKIYFPIDSTIDTSAINFTLITTIKPSTTTIKPTKNPVSISTFTSYTKATPLVSTKSTNLTVTNKIDIPKEIGSNNLTTINPINETNQDFHQLHVNQTITSTISSNITLVTMETLNGNQSISNETNQLANESRSLNSEKAELIVEQNSNMKTVSILIGIFVIASAVGVIVLWKRHKNYLGSSVSADSELRFLAHDVDN